MSVGLKYKPYMTPQRIRVLELLEEYGVLNSKGLADLTGVGTKDTWPLLKGGAAAGLWEECPGAPGTYRLKPDVDETK